MTFESVAMQVPPHLTQSWQRIIGLAQGRRKGRLGGKGRGKTGSKGANREGALMLGGA